MDTLPGILPTTADVASAVDLQPVELVQIRECHFKAKPKDPATGRKRLGCARCGLAKHDAVHYGAPPSINVLGSGNPMLYWQTKQRWMAILHSLLVASGLPKPLGRVMVEGEVTFPDRTRRDQGNHRVLIEKALGDTLQAGWLEDDSWDFYEFGNLTYRYAKGVSATRLMLFPAAIASGLADARPQHVKPDADDGAPVWRARGA